MNKLRRTVESFGFHSAGRWIFPAILVGAAAGCVAILFERLGRLVTRWTLGEFAGYMPATASGEHSIFSEPTTAFSPWMIVVVMVAGGLVSGLIVYTFAPEAAGAGTDAAIEAFHRNRGEIRGRVIWVKTIASAVTLGTGGSGGREGPIAQIGAGLGSWLGKRFHLSPRDRRIIMAAGMGAGVGAIFRAPLAGAVFAAEILYSDADLEADVIVPAAAASIVAYSIFTRILPESGRFAPLFGDELDHISTSPLELIPYTVLAIVLALVGILYVRIFHRSQEIFEASKIRPQFRPAIGAGIAGLIGVTLLYLSGSNENVLAVLGTGYGTLQQTMSDSAAVGVPLLVTIAFAKIITTAATIGSGGAGGVFGPSMVIGGCLGSAVGIVAHSIWPTVWDNPEAFAVVGMAGFFAGVARAPISTIIMVRAVTGDFGLLVPTMLVTTLTFIACHRWGIYRQQVPTRMDSKAHRGDFIVDVLEGLHVSDVYRRDPDILLIPESMTLDDIVHRLAHNHQHYFPVIDKDGRLVGIFTDDDVRSYLYDDVLWNLVVAEDIMVSDFVSVTPPDDLNVAMKSFTMLNLDELPVVDSEDPGKFLGMLRRKETIAAYNQRVMEHKKATEEEASRGR